MRDYRRGEVGANEIITCAFAGVHVPAMVMTVWRRDAGCIYAGVSSSTELPGAAGGDAGREEAQLGG